MNEQESNDIMLDAASMIIKLIGFHDVETGARYGAMVKVMTTILSFCVDFKSMGEEASVEFLDGTSAAMKAMILQQWTDSNSYTEETKQ